MAGKSNQTSFEMIIGARDGFSKTMGKFSDWMRKTDSNTRGVRRAWKNLEQTGGCLVRTISTLGKGISLAFGASGGLVAMTKRMGSLALEADNTASRAGLDLKTWQEYAYAAERAGVSAASLESALGSLNDKSREAAKEGDKDGLLKKLGLDPKTAEGKAHASTVILTRLADKIKELKDAGEHDKAAGLARAFGVGAMMPVLAKGSKSLEDMRRRAQELNLVFGEDSVDASRDFSESWSDIISMLQSFGRSIFQAALPAISELMGYFRAWIEEQRKLVNAGGLTKWIKGFNVKALWQDIQSLLVTLKNIALWVNNIVQRFGGWKNVLYGISILMGGKLLFAFLKFGAAFITNPLFTKGIGLLLGLSKVMGVLAWKGAGALGVALKPLAVAMAALAWKGAIALGVALKDLAVKGIAVLGAAFVKLGLVLSAAFAKLGAAIMATPLGWFLAAIALIGASVYAVYKNWDSFAAYFQNLWQGVKDAFSRNWLEGILKLLSDFNPVRLVLKGMNELVAYFTGINLAELGAGWIASIQQGLTGQWTALAGWLREKVASLTDWMPSWVKDKLGITADAAAKDAASVRKTEERDAPAPAYTRMAREAAALDPASPAGKRKRPGRRDVAAAIEEAPAREDAKAGIPAAGESGAPAESPSLAPAAKSIMESRTSKTEHVERQENVVRIELGEGLDARVSGPSKGVARHGNSLQVGELAWSD